MFFNIYKKKKKIIKILKILKTKKKVKIKRQTDPTLYI